MAKLSQGTPYHVNRGHYARVDTSHGEAYRVWCAGSADQSPQHVLYPTGYDARCASCWLGHGHTEALHACQVAKAEA